MNREGKFLSFIIFLRGWSSRRPVRTQPTQGLSPSGERSQKLHSPFFFKNKSTPTLHQISSTCYPDFLDPSFTYPLGYFTNPRPIDDYIKIADFSNLPSLDLLKASPQQTLDRRRGERGVRLVLFRRSEVPFSKYRFEFGLKSSFNKWWYNIFRKQSKMSSIPYSVYYPQSHLSQPNSHINSNPFGEGALFHSQISPTDLWFHPLLGYFVPPYGLSTPQASLLSPDPSQLETNSFIHSDVGGNIYNNAFYYPEEPEEPREPLRDNGNSAIVLKIEEEEVLVETVRRYESLSLKEKKPKKNVDKDYHPHKTEKREIRKRLHENQNRNVVPNEINQIISFLQKRTKSGAVLERLWKKYPVQDNNYSVARFYLYQKVLKEGAGHYSNEASLRLLSGLYEPECRVWPQGQQRHYIMLSRMLVGHFLREDSIFIILTSKRMKSHKKLEHLRARRQVSRRVKQLLHSN